MREKLLPAGNTILAVDDNPDDLRLLVSLLGERGYEVRPTRDAASALAAARLEPPALILLDIQMPLMDGYAACRRFKDDARTAGIPIIFISALSEVFDKVRAFREGGVDYISKPFQAEEVAARIETQLRLASMQQHLEAQNCQLQQEIAERMRAEAELRGYQGQLESLVQLRTAELTDAVAQLRQEIYERQRIEEQIKASLHEKEILLKEIHHRVKNNLQIIASLQYLQAQKIDVPQFAELLHESQNRITSMAYVHEMLYQSDDFTRVDFEQYLRSLSSSLLASYGIDQRQIRLSINAPGVAMTINLAIPCGLIVNELVSNALKHAFPGGRPGSIQIGADEQPEGRYTLEICDDGVGIAGQEQKQAATLGLRLVDRLVRQLNGALERGGGPGTSYRISFPKTF